MIDVLLESLRFIVVFSLTVFIWTSASKRPDISKNPGWKFIRLGFILLSLGNLVDITDEFESLNRFVIIGHTPGEAFLEKIVCYIGGFVSVFWGFIKWLPSITDSFQLKNAVEDLGKELAQRKNTEELLKTSEKNLDQVFDASPWSLAIVRISDNKLLKVNQANFDFHGITREELLATPARQIYVNPEDKNRLYRELRKRGRADHLEFEVKRYGIGDYRWAYLSAYPITYFGEECLVVGFQDITELKQAEERLKNFSGELELKIQERTQELKESEGQFRNLVSFAADGIFLHDSKGKFLDVNPKACESLGYTREELLALSVPDVETGVSPKHLKEFFENAEYSKPRTFYGTHRRKDGTVFPVEVHAGPIELGGKRNFIALARDVSERKKAEDRLRKLNQTFLALGPDIQKNIDLLTDSCARILEADFAFYGRRSEDYIQSVSSFGMPEGFNFRLKGEGLPCNDTLRRGIDDGVYCVLHLPETSYNKTLPMIGEYGLKTYMGHPVFLFGKSVGSICVFFKQDLDMDPDSGKIMEILATAIGIEEERLQVELELKNAKESAEKATKLKDKFVSLVSHDLRGPLTTIKGLLDVLKDSSADSKPHLDHEVMDRIVKSSDYMQRMIANLLNVTRLQTGQIALHNSFFDVHFVINSIVWNFLPLAEGKGIRMTNEVPKGTRLYADQALINEVIQNLIGNAIKFSRKGDRIQLFTPKGDPFTIAVRDTGVGIHPHLIPDLFKFEEKTITEGTEQEIGTGLGLPYSREIMEVHGGTIEVQSEEGVGSTFYMKLPVVRPRILVVDDQEADRYLIRHFLKNEGIEVLEAENGEKGLEMMEKIRPDLILSDLKMPILDGFGFLDRIRKNSGTGSIPFILITSDIQPDTREEAIRLGADDLITKPVKKDDILSRIHRFLI